MNVFEKAFANMRRANAKDAPAAAPPESERLADAIVSASTDFVSDAPPDGPGVDDADEQQYLLHKEAADAAAVLEAPPAPPPSTSDEGVLYEWVSSSEIVNLSNDPIDSRRRELHVAGRAYHHVAETLGHWLYRRDA